MHHLDPPYVSYAGTDWGGGEFAFTVIWIMARDEEGRWRLIYLRKFDERDPMKQVKIISNLIPFFNVKRLVADIGYGAVQVSELQKQRRRKLRTGQPGRGSFVSVSIPEELINEIDKLLEKKKLGYESRPEFIKEAVRKRLEEIKALSK